MEETELQRAHKEEQKEKLFLATILPAFPSSSFREYL
jgi:hypothetical protein